MPPVSKPTVGLTGNAGRSRRLRLFRGRQGILAAVLTMVALCMVGCGSDHPRTEVLKGTNPVLSDIYLRITGPGEAVYYIAQRFRQGGSFNGFSFHKTSTGKGVFLPPRVRERKLCASTHVIRAYDAPQLQEWRGKTLAITIYGKETSRTFCSVLTGNLYAGAS
jgi:hypothetical protein